MTNFERFAFLLYIPKLYFSKIIFRIPLINVLNTFVGFQISIKNKKLIGQTMSDVQQQFQLPQPASKGTC